MKTKLISLEGGDGAGKTTQAALLASRLQDAGLSVVLTREPGGTSLGERLRQVLLDPGQKSLTARTEALLYAAARAQLVEEVIWPALRENRIVIADRFLDSSVAYQGYGRGLEPSAIRKLNRWATGELEPGLTIILDLAPEVGLLRRMERGGRADRLEKEGPGLQQRVQEGYRHLARSEPERFWQVDASAPQGAVAEAIWRKVTEFLGI